MSTPPLPEGLADTPATRVANRLHSAAIHLLRRARVADRETGLTPERLSLLSVLTFAGPRTMGELAAIEQVSAPAISRSVKALEADGLVRRQRPGRDRRQVRVQATAAGRRLMDAGRRRRLEYIERELRDLGRRELEQLGRAATILESLRRRVAASRPADTTPSGATP